MVKIGLLLISLIQTVWAGSILNEEEAWGIDDPDKRPIKMMPNQASKEDLKSLLLQPKENQDYEYRIGPQDLIRIEVFQAPELSHTARVDYDGAITLPLIGRVNIKGKTVKEIEKIIEDKLGKDYLQDPHVTVLVEEYKSQTITVDGWVKKPGIYPLTGKMTFLQAIAMAQGMDKLADFDQVAVFRKKGDSVIGFILSYEKIRSGQMPDPILQNGDIIVVNRSGSKAAWNATQELMRSFAGWVILF